MATLTAAEAADLFRREPDRFLDVGAGEVAHRRIGSGPDVLFVHGWPISGATFRKLLPHVVDHVGDSDPFFPVERARQMVDTFPDARLDVIEGAGLFSHEERPEEVARALLPTLTGQR